MTERLLVVDDEQSMREWLNIALSQDGFEVESAGNGEDALKVLERTPVDLALVDLRMAGFDGLETLRRIKQLDDSVSVVIMTAYATAETAVQALKEGAYDYIIKPFKVDELRHLVQKALEERRLRGENLRLRDEVARRYQFGNLIGKSPKMQEVFSTIARLGDTKATVLITGESGTGKELVAKAIHFNSSRKERAFVAVNCGAIPQELMESELFGHVKGAFTGAVAAKQGLFEVADGGTLFLDEVTELPLHLQVKLLRVLEDPEIRPVGGVRPVRVDVRIVAATNRDVSQTIAAKTFREDLFYRLNVISLRIPPLRERREDIPLLVTHFLEKFAAGGPPKLISPDVLSALERYGWPGNVRELEHVIER
ncbi:MAG TPA: sigma-54 dependent transcriptional regulator, partial [Acidimicrobiales bacterium]